MADFSAFSLDELHALALADLANRAPGINVARTSDEYKRFRALCLAVLSLHYHLDGVFNNLLPDTAVAEHLVRWGVLVGVVCKPATAAYKAAALRVVGTAGSTIPLHAALTHADGTAFEIATAATVPALGYIDCDVVARTLGSVGRKHGELINNAGGEILTFTTPPAGCNAACELHLDIDEGGDDQESYEQLRIRILDRLRYAGMGGNANDYRAWELEQTYCQSAYVFPLRQGLGSVDVAFLKGGSGADRIPTAGDVAAMQVVLDEVRPVSIPDFRVLTVVDQPTSVEVTVLPEDGAEYQFDWDDSAGPLVVLTWNGATRVLTFTTTRPADLTTGCRIVHKRALGGHDGREYVVEAVGTSTITLADDAELIFSPTAGDLIYAGGPLVETVRQAILAYADAFGPGRGDYAAGSWEGSLRPSGLFKVAQLVPGVLDSAIVLPAANVDGANAAPSASIGLLTLTTCTVRRMV
jgi:uncharacterized phage protein gp47/JayE